MTRPDNREMSIRQGDICVDPQIFCGVLYKGYILLDGLLKTVSFSGVFPTSVVPKDSEASSNIVISCGTWLCRDGSSGCLNRSHCNIDRCVTRYRCTFTSIPWYINAIFELIYIYTHHILYHFLLKQYLLYYCVIHATITTRQFP